MEIISAKVPAEQFIDIIKSALTSDLKIASGQQFVEILLRITVPKSRRDENNVH
jgi:hypothetical protein